jgi:hypothetical protein
MTSERGVSAIGGCERQRVDRSRKNVVATSVSEWTRALGKTRFEQETMKPGEMQGLIQKPQSQDENLLSWLHGFLLNHVWPGWGAQPCYVFGNGT